MITIVAISDTHNQHRQLKLPKGDILVHTGDQAHGRGSLSEIQDFNDWMGELDFEHKIAIAGNHDFIFQENATVIKKYTYNYTYLCDESYECMGLKFYGSPWQPEFWAWAYNLPRGGPELAAKWAAIPDDTNILLTHGPAYGVGDMTSRGEPAGCSRLRDRLLVLPNLKAHFYGHIHEGYGQHEINGVPNINCSVLDYKYKLVNQPITIEVEV